ncbi:hypothetical protein HDV57DRAFT_489644 [Trichoderma longibrachiatum]|uniref:Uncharacterized protein n=1 Tax=Trichoderma longibrachiatum ATCC 18648 TaxID=983965 RepID=A0A2T4BQD2_TRILO|nr:hypothetical protein M440DRAFT_215830 [Trichoderma longibrachiatum ATCC 18648]
MPMPCHVVNPSCFVLLLLLLLRPSSVSPSPRFLQRKKDPCVGDWHPLTVTREGEVLQKNGFLQRQREHYGIWEHGPRLVTGKDIYGVQRPFGELGWNWHRIHGSRCDNDGASPIRS